MLINIIPPTLTYEVDYRVGLLYLHPRFRQSLQFLHIHIVGRGAVKEAGQHDQPHYFNRFPSYGQGLALHRDLFTCRSLKKTGLNGKEGGGERRCAAVSRPDVLPRQIFSQRTEACRAFIGYLRDSHQDLHWARLNNV